MGRKMNKSTSLTVKALNGVARLEGCPVLVKTTREWPVNPAVEALTDEERNKTDRGHPPYHRMEHAHSEEHRRCPRLVQAGGIG